MDKSKKALIVLSVLEKLYPSPKIPLKHENTYTLLIAVLLSAQCTDKRVNTITPLLFQKAKTAKEMVDLSVETIEEIIRPCGLSKTKSNAIWNLSKKLIDEYEGTVPDTLEALESLPGVGHKTASVILCQGFQKPAFPVDTHIHRCAKRWGLSDGKNVVKTEKDLKEIFEEAKWIPLHLQIIYFAREYCPARGHNEKICPICSKVRG